MHQQSVRDISLFMNSENSLRTLNLFLKIRNTCGFFLPAGIFDLLYAYAFFLHYLTVSLMVFLTPFTAIT